MCLHPGIRHITPSRELWSGKEPSFFLKISSYHGESDWADLSDEKNIQHRSSSKQTSLSTSLCADFYVLPQMICFSSAWRMQNIPRPSWDTDISTPKLSNIACSTTVPHVKTATCNNFHKWKKHIFPKRLYKPHNKTEKTGENTIQAKLKTDPTLPENCHDNLICYLFSAEHVRDNSLSRYTGYKIGTPPTKHGEII